MAAFDVLKGIAIYLVVMGHVLTMCIRDIDSAVLFKLVGEIHMPIFSLSAAISPINLRETAISPCPICANASGSLSYHFWQ